jgi:hypothetical protein
MDNRGDCDRNLTILYCPSHAAPSFWVQAFVVKSLR